MSERRPRGDLENGKKDFIPAAKKYLGKGTHHPTAFLKDQTVFLSFKR